MAKSKKLPKQFLIRHFSSNEDAENWLNEQWPEYELVNIADTSAYVTVAVRRRDAPNGQV